MAVAALIIMNESREKPAPLKYPKKTYQIFDDPDVWSCVLRLLTIDRAAAAGDARSEIGLS
jgi:hypothetical protein